jgi:hypothetical protein
MTRSSARVDVIAGTSAGGINGAALALAQSSRKADLSSLRELWTEQGRMDMLLRAPFEGHPTSLLRGDYFLEQLHNAMAQLATGYEHSGRPADLTLTTTLLTGAQDVTVDALGQRLRDVRYNGCFHFREGAFERESVDATVAALALAARSSASYPVAFDATFVPAGAGSTTDPLRPDMASWADWCTDPQAPEGDKSRFTVPRLGSQDPSRDPLTRLTASAVADGPSLPDCAVERAASSALRPSNCASSAAWPEPASGSVGGVRVSDH